jgi:hypothetical protein
MVMMLSFGAILTISMIVFASYGVLYWLFGGSRPASATPVVEARTSSAPTWLTPVVLVGLIIFGLKAGMQTWFVLLGSVFAVVMLVKLNVLCFTCEPRHASTPPPLPREPRFQDATHHTRLASTAPQKSRFGVFATVLTIAVVIGFTMFSVVVMREERIRSPRNLQMVAVNELSGAMHEVHAEIHQGMQEFNKEMQSGAREIAKAAKESARVFKMPPTQPPVAAPTPPTTVVISPAISPTQPDRIDKVLGRNGSKTAESSKKSKKSPKPAPLPEVREPATRVDYNLSPQELADWGTEKSPNGLYIILTDPKDPMDDEQAAFQRAIALLKNHLDAKHPGVGARTEGLILPSFAWCEANGLIHKRHEPVGNGVVVKALGTNFSPKAMDLAYNYHLGCERTREAAKGYFGGLLVLGGLGLLLRIGTGIRPTAPVPSA